MEKLIQPIRMFETLEKIAPANADPFS